MENLPANPPDLPPSGTILARLRAMYPDARTGTLRKMVAAGHVSLNGERVRSIKAPALAGDVVRIDPGRTKGRLPGQDIIYSDADILVCAKPSGVVTSTTRDEKRPSLIASLEKRVDRDAPGGNIYLVHRLDRDASGLLIFARDVKSLANLKMQFRRHTITRRYWAWVHGSPAPVAELHDTLAEDPNGRVICDPKGKPARLHYRRIQAADHYCLLEVELYTGRKHQIRVQLARRGWPVAGDRVYGRADGQPRLLLHAIELVIHHPRSGKRMAFRLPPPTDFQPRTPGPRATLRPAGRPKRRKK